MSAIRFPKVSKKLGMGFGLDLHFDGKGFDKERLHPSHKRFFDNYRGDAAYFFFSFQPKSRGRLCAQDYFSAYDDLAPVAPGERLALHHTQLNLASLSPYDREETFTFTNELIERYGLSWVNEDLGFWFIKGHSLPYPMPPLLTREGLAACIRNVKETNQALACPLLVEFPGFSEETSLVLGQLHAYDFFHQVAQESGAAVTLDTGHLLSYQWLRGLRGEDLYSELERLPLSHCFEIHLSGSEIVEGQFLDYHHGILLEEQLILLERLLALCPNVKAVTYEDPRFTEDGVLVEKAQEGYKRLKQIISAWRSLPAQPERQEGRAATHTHALEEASKEEAACDSNNYDEDFLYSLLFLADEERAGAVRLDPQQPAKAQESAARFVLEGMQGKGGLRASYAKTLTLWGHLQRDPQHKRLMRSFLASPDFAASQDVSYCGGGISIEEAFYVFLSRQPCFAEMRSTLEDEFCYSMIRMLQFDGSMLVKSALVLQLQTGFCALRPVQGGFILYATVGGKMLQGQITALLAEILRMEARGALPEYLLQLSEGVSRESLLAVLGKLCGLGLLTSSSLSVLTRLDGPTAIPASN